MLSNGAVSSATTDASATPRSRSATSKLMLADEYPETDIVGPQTRGGPTCSFTIEVPDVDAAFERAVGAGATIDRPVADQFHGNRMGSLRDPFGHRWTLSTPIAGFDRADYVTGRQGSRLRADRQHAAEDPPSGRPLLLQRAGARPRQGTGVLRRGAGLAVLRPVARPRLQHLGSPGRGQPGRRPGRTALPSCGSSSTTSMPQFSRYASSAAPPTSRCCTTRAGRPTASTIRGRRSASACRQPSTRGSRRRPAWRQRMASPVTRSNRCICSGSIFSVAGSSIRSLVCGGSLADIVWPVPLPSVASRTSSLSTPGGVDCDVQDDLGPEAFTNRHLPADRVLGGTGTTPSTRCSGRNADGDLAAVVVRQRRRRVPPEP